MLKEQKSIIIVFIIIVLFELAVAYIGDIRHREPWGDETHLYKTAVQFGTEFNLQTLREYPEMSTPLPFILYGWWGKIFGYELFTLRILSIIIAIACYLLFYKILLMQLSNIRLAAFGTFFLMIHPYMVGLSIFVFTDMPAIFFMLGSYYYLKKSNYPLFLLGAGLSVLCRQYMLFYVAAVGCFFVLDFIINKNKNAIKGIFYSLGSVIPYGCLIILWGGTSPDNIYREMYLDEGLYFKLHVFYLYAALLFFYLLPYYLFIYRNFLNKIIFLFALAGSIGYYFFPVQPAKYSVDIGVHTVGLLHKGLVYLISSDSLVHLIFYIGVLAGLQVLCTLIKSSYNKIKTKSVDKILIVNLIILFFFMVMPFSYLGWEKYFVPLLPFLILRFSLMLQKEISL